MTNPLPCPHCGAEPTVFFGRNAKECWAYVSCQCGAMTKNFHATTDKAAKELAVEVWNRRVGESMTINKTGDFVTHDSRAKVVGE